MGIAFHPTSHTSPTSPRAYLPDIRRDDERRPQRSGTATRSERRRSFSTGFPAAGFGRILHVAIGTRPRCSTINRRRWIESGNAQKQSTRRWWKKISAGMDGGTRQSVRRRRLRSYGHRNPQGLVFHPTTGVLYSTEHGPNDNDEVNIIRQTSATLAGIA